MSIKQAAAILDPSEKQVNFFVCLTAATAALAGLLFGFDTGVISGAILFIKGEFGFGLLPALALGLGMAMLPESPRWLLLHQHKEAAMKVLSRIRPTKRVAEITAEVSDILKDAEPGHGKLSDLFSPMVMRVLFLVIALAFIQQITGINTVIYYAPTIFQQAGFQSALGSIIATAGVGLVNVLLTLASIPLLDQLAPPPLLSPTL